MLTEIFIHKKHKLKFLPYCVCFCNILEACVQPHAPAALFPCKSAPVPVEELAGWASEPVWTI
jgi:hypothetical protein